MGSGLSMTSVNKIKELAEAREYSLALEIIDSQDLTKSLNPQFVRLCGDIYIANERYEDARKTLVMAHKMAPEAKRVIYSLVDLYFRMGYKQLAEFYFNLYMFDAEPNLPQTNHMNYIYSKAQGCPLDEIETLLFPMYSDMMDYDWSFELYLLLKLQGRNADAKSIAEDYFATYKNEPNVAIMEELEATQDTKEKLEKLFYVYSKNELEDDLDIFDELREEEKVLIEADSLRMNPKEAEIQIIFDDNDKVTLGEKLRYKRHIKEQEKLAKKARQETNEEEPVDEDSSEKNLEENSSVEDSTENSDYENSGIETKDNEIDEETADENTEGKTNIFKKLFSKFKKDEGDVVDNIDEVQEIEVSDDESVEKNVTEISETEETLAGSGQTEEKLTEDDAEDVESQQVEEPEIKEIQEVDVAIEEDSENGETVEDELEIQAEEAFNPTVGDSVMQEIYGKKKISIKSELGEDSFFTDFEEGFSKEIHDTGNPFDALYDSNKTFDDEDASGDDVQEERAVSSSFSFEEAQLEPEDVEELEVDDFSKESFDFDFDDNDNEDEESVEKDEETVEIDSRDDESDVEIEDIEVETVDVETEIENIETEKVDVEVETVDVGTDMADVEDALDTSDDYLDADSEAVDLDVETVKVEEENQELDMYDEELDSEVMDVDTEVSEIDSNFTQETDVEADSAYYDELVIDEQEEVTCMDVITTSSAVDSMKNESVYDSIKNNSGFDYPEFKTTLFPEYGKEIVEVENNFNEIMTRAQDKINENLMKEEQMQREAEALLASLGIDIGSASTISRTETRLNVSSVAIATNALDGTMTESKHENNILQEVPKQNNEQNDYSPSRDELKASLKIDSVKKSILKHIKEYR